MRHTLRYTGSNAQSFDRRGQAEHGQRNTLLEGDSEVWGWRIRMSEGGRLPGEQDTRQTGIIISERKGEKGSKRETKKDETTQELGRQ